MEITNLDKLNIFKEYINSISKKDNLAIIYDTDVDGITSAVITSKALDKLGLKYFQRPRNPKSRSLDLSILTFLEENKINKIIFLDLSVESYKDSNLLNNYDVLVIDHHPILKEYNSNFKIIKSFELQDKLEGFDYCTAHMVYDLFSSMLDLNDLDWILVCGIIGDVTYKKHMSLINTIFKKYNLDRVDLNNVYTSEIGKVVEFANYALSIGSFEEINKLYNIFYNSLNFIVAFEKLDYILPIKKEFDKFISNFEKNKIEYNNVIFYEIKSEYNLNSLISTYISLNLYFGILVCLDIKKEVIHISARCQNSKVHLGEMLSDCVNNLENSQGGGHKVAAGGIILKKDKDIFIQNVIDWLNKH